VAVQDRPCHLAGRGRLTHPDATFTENWSDRDQADAHPGSRLERVAGPAAATGAARRHVECIVEPILTHGRSITTHSRQFCVVLPQRNSPSTYSAESAGRMRRMSGPPAPRVLTLRNRNRLGRPGLPLSEVSVLTSAVGTYGFWRSAPQGRRLRQYAPWSRKYRLRPSLPAPLVGADGGEVVGRRTRCRWLFHR